MPRSISPPIRVMGSPRAGNPAGMLLEAMRQHTASPAETLFIGDALTDADAAAAAGVTFRLVLTGKGAAAPPRA